MPGPPRMALVAVTVAAVSCMVVLAPTGLSSAQTLQPVILSPGQVANLDSSSVPLKPLADGRLASAGIEVQVAGVAFTDHVADSSQSVTPAAGAQLVVLEAGTTWQQDGDSANSGVDEGTFTISSGSFSAPLQANQIDYPQSTEQFFAAAIPSGGPAVLTLSVDGLTESLNLRTDRRPPGTPQILYRSADQPSVDVSPGGLSDFTGSSPLGPVTGQFGVSHAYLAAWKPFAKTYVTDPASAYLDVEFDPSHLSIGGSQQGSVSPSQPLSDGQVAFVLPGGRTVAATVQTDYVSGDFFSGDFYALVPADISSVQVIVSGPLAAEVAPQDPFSAPVDTTVTLGAPLKETVNFPPPWKPPSASASAVPASPPAVHRASGGSGAAWPAVIGAVVAAVGGLLLFFAARRRRSLLDPHPVQWPPLYLAPAATNELTRPWLALPAGEPSLSTGDETPEAAPDRAGHPAIVLRLLGPLEVEGLERAIRSQPVRRLLVVLGLNPDRPMGADELAMAISDRPDRRDPKAQSLYSYASSLRRCLPKGLLPDADADGYRLDHRRVVCDANVLRRVADEPPGSPGWAERAEAALEMVRGRPLEGGSWEGVEPAVRSLAASIDHVAHALATKHLAEGRAAAAEWAIGKGLAGAPGSVTLWGDRLDAAAAGSGYGLERAWEDCRAVLKADAGMLAGSYQALRRDAAAP